MDTSLLYWFLFSSQNSTAEFEMKDGVPASSVDRRPVG